MRTVWKYPLQNVDDQSLSLPGGAEILHVGEQDGRLCLWAEVDTTAPERQHLIALVMTGAPVPEGYLYLDTIVGKTLVLHVYDQEVRR